jgi:DNA-binding LacI/PurR family transcriptional regulator
VVFQRYSRHSSVNTDSAVVGRLAAGHLLALGHRRVAVVNSDAGSQAQSLRARGFQASLVEAGLGEAPEVLAPNGHWARAAYAATIPLIEAPAAGRPTAIFATNDLLAIGVMRAIRDRSLRIPDDVAVVGCDDAEFAAFQDPPLTTIHLPTEEMAARAAAILLDLIHQRVSPPVHEMFASCLVVRRSTDALVRSHRGPDTGGSEAEVGGR